MGLLLNASDKLLTKNVLKAKMVNAFSCSVFTGKSAFRNYKKLGIYKSMELEKWHSQVLRVDVTVGPLGHL